MKIKIATVFTGITAAATLSTALVTGFVELSKLYAHPTKDPVLVGLEYGPKFGAWLGDVKFVKITVQNRDSVVRSFVGFGFDWTGYVDYGLPTQRTVWFSTNSNADAVLINPGEAKSVELPFWGDSSSYSPELQDIALKGKLENTLVSKNMLVGKCSLDLYFYDASDSLERSTTTIDTDCMPLESALQNYFRKNNVTAVAKSGNKQLSQ